MLHTQGNGYASAFEAKSTGPPRGHGASHKCGCVCRGSGEQGEAILTLPMLVIESGMATLVRLEHPKNVSCKRGAMITLLRRGGAVDNGKARHLRSFKRRLRPQKPENASASMRGGIGGA